MTIGQADAGEIARSARAIRKTVVTLSHDAHAPHLGSALSCVDIVATAYGGALNLDPQNPGDPDRDRFILSKGHAAMTLYAALAHRGYFPMSELSGYNRDGGHLAEHPGPGCAPGVEAATGSLGHGLPIACGLALAARIAGRRYRAVAVLSDGECNEGSVWEAALFAAAQRLGNVVAIVDYNKWQATGRSDEVLGLAPLAAKWAAFGWEAHEVDGHDPAALLPLMRPRAQPSDRPLAIIAHTVKGKGVSFMEDDNNWHYRVPNDGELARALAEIDAR